jgi:quinol monooxygenase YgiN
MANVEFCAKLKIQVSQLVSFKRHVDAIVGAANAAGSGALRCDWFIDEIKNEAAAMVVYRDESAMLSHHDVVGSHYDALADCSKRELEFFGDPSAAIVKAMSRFNPRVLKFAYGLNKTSTPMHGALTNEVRGIEIYSRFTIHGGHFDACKAVGAALIPIVSSKDPGTTRYDWFYDEASLQCVAMDAYADTPSMFAHMKNAHDVHEELFDHSTMMTEFLGELPQEAKAAVARYDPYILPVYAGLKRRDS